MLTRSQMITIARKPQLDELLAEDANLEPDTMSPFNTLRSCAAAMAESKLTSFPVVGADGKLVGVITINDLLKGRSEQTHRESDRERVLRLRWPFTGRPVTSSSAMPPTAIEDETDIY